MGLITKHYDGTSFLNIPDKTYDETSTSLKLPGKGVLNWGEAYLNNFVHLLENFASNTEPRSPQVGQLWFNKETNALNVYTNKNEWIQINKDLEIEKELEEITNALKSNYSDSMPPLNPVKGQLWYDEHKQILNVFSGETWVPFGANSYISYDEPEKAKKGDLWFDKNVNALKVNDGIRFQKVLSAIESTTQPTNASVGQFWFDTKNDKIFVYKLNNNQYYWEEFGVDTVSEGEEFPKIASVGAFHLIRKEFSTELYVNKGSRVDPVWVKIPEFGGAIKSKNEPLSAVDGMFWLNENNVLKIRKNNKWVDIDETAISFVNENIPEYSKNGMLWFDTSDATLKIKIDNDWLDVQNNGVISYGNKPQNAKLGQLWFDKDHKKLRIFSTSGWTEVVSSDIVVSYVEPNNTNIGQFWLDTTTSELKINKNGRWAAIPEKARANVVVPDNPKIGDILYIDDKLKVYNGESWQDINISIDNITNADVSIDYDSISHEIVISDNGNVKRVPLAVKREVIVENVGITDEVIEIIKPNIEENERRLINVEKIDVRKPFFLFKNGVFSLDYEIDNKDIILKNSSDEDEIELVQLFGDFTISYLIKKFISSVNGEFVIDNYTRTEEEELKYREVKAEYDAKLKEFLNLHGDDATIDDLTEDELNVLKEIESRYPVKKSNNIQDLTSGSILILKEGLILSNDDVKINEDGDNKIKIKNTTKDERFYLIQIVVGNDYKTSFFKKEYSFVVEQEEDNVESTQLNVRGMMMSDMLNRNETRTRKFGRVDVNYTYDENTKVVEFDVIDLNLDQNIFVLRNNLYVSQKNIEIDKERKKIRLVAEKGDSIRFLQFYLPNRYIPLEFNYNEVVANQDNQVVIELNYEFDLSEPLLVYRNGILQETSTYNIITEETVKDEDGNDFTVTGLRKVQYLGNYNSLVKKGDVITVMQISQPKTFNIVFREFNVTQAGIAVFDDDVVDINKPFKIFKNGIKLLKDDFEIKDNKIIVKDCLGVSEEELKENPNAIGDIIIFFQFYPKNNNELVQHKEILNYQKDVTFYQLNNIDYIKKEYMMVFKNGQLITRKKESTLSNSVEQVNIFDTVKERIYHNKTIAYDAYGMPIRDENGNIVYHVDPNDYEDVSGFTIDIFDENESLEIYEYTEKTVDTSNLILKYYYEKLLENKQRIYTSKFDQLSKLTMVFVDGILLDRELQDNKDYIRENGVFKILGDYAVDDVNKSIILKNWNNNKKLTVHQFTAKNQDIKTIKLQVKILEDNTYEVFLPNNQKYIPNSGGIEVYVNRMIQWSNEDFIESTDNRITFIKALKKGDVVHMIIRK